MRSVVGGVSVTGLALVLLVNYLNSGDVGTAITNTLEQVPMESQQVDSQEFAGEDSYEQFAAAVLGSANDAWRGYWSDYREPTLVLFRGGTESGCGGASSRVGPHYCPLDETIYLDETFFDELTNQLGAQGGDVAEAYVIAHEVGHHVQNVMGLLDSGGRSNEESVEIELQADCFAGLWAYSLRDEGIFEQGEIVEAMDAAAAVGDDRIQEKVTGQVNPETWTHGSSDARVAAFTKGYESGTLDVCMR